MAKQEYIKANREWLDANLRNRVVWDWLRIATKSTVAPLRARHRKW